MILYTRVTLFRCHQGIISLYTKLLRSQEICVFQHILQNAFHDSADDSITVVSGVKMDIIMLLLIAKNCNSEFS
jgi:hypothetical protein